MPIVTGHTIWSARVLLPFKSTAVRYGCDAARNEFLDGNRIFLTHGEIFADEDATMG